MSEVTNYHDNAVQYSKDSNADLTVGNIQKRLITRHSSGLAQGCFSLNIQNRKNDASLFSLICIKILTNKQKKI